MVNLDNHKSNEFYTFQPERPKRPSLFSYFLVGIFGALLGGLLFSAILVGGDIISQDREVNENEVYIDEDPDEERAIPDEPLEYQHTDVVEAVEEITPAVVGISNAVAAMNRGQEVYMEQATGSGVIIDPDGYIITNQHVIEDADRLDVIFGDGSTATAEPVGQDSLTDLAVIKVETEEPLEYAQISGTKNVRPGETAIAIGNPLGVIFQHTVTKGVVSAIERQVPIPGSEYQYTFIQTDAAINEGNSGGPLVNLNGDIIGINSAKIQDPLIEGIGFAIPSSTVARVMNDLMEYGRVRRAYMGVYIMDLSDVTGIGTDRGVYIQEIESGGPADEAGLQQEDVIVGISDVRIDFTAQLFDQLLQYQPGDKTDIEVKRDDEVLEFTIELEEMPQ